MGLARGLVVLWRWTLGVIDTLLMNFYVWDVGDKCDTIQTIGPIVNAVCLIIIGPESDHWECLSLTD